MHKQAILWGLALGLVGLSAVVRAEEKSLKSRYIRVGESIATVYDIEPKIAARLDALAAPIVESLDPMAPFIQQFATEGWYTEKTPEERNRVTQYVCLRVGQANDASNVFAARWKQWAEPKGITVNWTAILWAFIGKQRKCFANANPNAKKMPNGVRDAVAKATAKLKAQNPDRISPLFRDLQALVADQAQKQMLPKAEWQRLKNGVEWKVNDKKRELDRALNEVLDNAVEFVWEGGFNLSFGNSVISLRIDVSGSSPELRVTTANLNMQQSAQSVVGCDDKPFAGIPDWKLACLLGLNQRPDLITEEVRKIETSLYVVDWTNDIGLSFEVVNPYESTASTLRPTPPDFFITEEGFQRFLGIGRPKS